MGGTADIDTVGGEVQGPDLGMGLHEESPGPGGDLEELHEAGCVLPALGLCGEHQQVGGNFMAVSVHHIPDGNGDPALPVHGHLRFFGPGIPDDPDPVFLHHLGEIFLLILAEDPDVPVEDGDRALRESLPEHLRVLDGHAAADPAAVGAFPVHGTGAVDHDHGSGGVEIIVPDAPLQFRLGHDPRAGTVPVQTVHVDLAEPGGDDHGTELDIMGLLPGPDGGREVPDEPGEALDDRTGVDRDVFGFVDPPDEGLDHILRPDIRGEQGVKLPQGSPQPILFFQDPGGDAHVRQSQGCPHPGHPPADDEHPCDDPHLFLGEGFKEAGFGNGHAHQIPGLLRGPGPIVGMHPGTVLADVGELEQVLVQPCLHQRILKEGTMGHRGTRGHDDPVEVVLLHLLPEILLGVLGTGEHHISGIAHIGKTAGIVRHLPGTEITLDVLATVADKDPDPGSLPSDLLLRGGGGGGDPIPRYDGDQGVGGGTAPHGHAVGDILGTLIASREVHPLAGGAHGIVKDGPGLEEPVLVHLDAQHPGKPPVVGRGHDGGGKYEQVHGLFLQFPRVGIEVPQRDAPVLVPDDRGGAGPNVIHPQPGRLVVVLLKILAVGAEVHVEHGNVKGGIRLLGNARLLGGVHAADP